MSENQSLPAGRSSTRRPRAFRSLVLAAVAGAAMPSIGSAAVYLVDLNTQNATGGAAAGSGGVNGTWNRYAAPTNLTGTLVDSTGAGSSITIGRSGTITDSGFGNGAAPDTIVFNNNVPNSQPAWATSSTDNRSSGDYFFTSTGADFASYTVNFGGLTPGTSVSIDVLASRNDGLVKGFYDYSLDGGATFTGFTVLNSDGTPTAGRADSKTAQFDAQADGFNNHRYLNFTGTTLPGSTLLVRVTDAQNVVNAFAVINAIRVITPVPEPTTASGLLVLGGLASLRRRRA